MIRSRLFVVKVSFNATIAVKHNTVDGINSENLLWMVIVDVRSCPQLIAKVICRENVGQLVCWPIAVESTTRCCPQLGQVTLVSIVVCYGVFVSQF